MAVQVFLGLRGQTAEGQALRRVAEALVSATGQFRDSDVWLFSAESTALVAALIEARLGRALSQRRVAQSPAALIRREQLAHPLVDSHRCAEHLETSHGGDDGRLPPLPRLHT
jgi:hypothetical protein